MAVADLAAEATTLHMVPEITLHDPAQLVNVDPVAAVAVSHTVESTVKLAEQVAPQLIPAGDDVTVPDPVPARIAVTATVPLANVAVTVRDWLMVT